MSPYRNCQHPLIIQEQVGYGGDFVYDKAIGSDIKWKKDKDLTKKVEVKKQRNKSEPTFLTGVCRD
jgi:hypothetical protein